MSLNQVYKFLKREYGPQGWWPLINHKGSNPTKTGAVKGYHPRDYSIPRNDFERFEICVGAILTQNTAWPNVEKALMNLDKINALNAKAILKIDKEKLKEAIRPAGYFNQKAKKLRIFAEFYLKLKGKTPTREELLSVWGVGKETADSILLYAYKEPIFVVDAYTRRIFSELGFFKKDADYDEIREMFEKELEKEFKANKDKVNDKMSRVIAYQEFHALIVEHAKRHYSGKERGMKCPLRKIIK
jgi:endonuclease-3 related protein